MKTEDTEVLGRWSQARSKPDLVDRPVRTAGTFVHRYNSSQYCSTETVLLIFHFLQTNITSQEVRGEATSRIENLMQFVQTSIIKVRLLCCGDVLKRGSRLRCGLVTTDMSVASVLGISSHLTNTGIWYVCVCLCDLL